MPSSLRRPRPDPDWLHRQAEQLAAPTPAADWVSRWLLPICLVLGLGGVLWQAVQMLWAHWAPPTEERSAGP